MIPAMHYVKRFPDGQYSTGGLGRTRHWLEAQRYEGTPGQQGVARYQGAELVRVRDLPEVRDSAAKTNRDALARIAKARRQYQ